jgi:hypothetical protein
MIFETFQINDAVLGCDLEIELNTEQILRPNPDRPRPGSFSLDSLKRLHHLVKHISSQVAI